MIHFVMHEHTHNNVSFPANQYDPRSQHSTRAMLADWHRRSLYTDMVDDYTWDIRGDFLTPVDITQVDNVWFRMRKSSYKNQHHPYQALGYVDENANFVEVLYLQVSQDSNYNGHFDPYMRMRYPDNTSITFDMGDFAGAGDAQDYDFFWDFKNSRMGLYVNGILFKVLNDARIADAINQWTQQGGREITMTRTYRYDANYHIYQDFVDMIITSNETTIGMRLKEIAPLDEAETVGVSTGVVANINELGFDSTLGVDMQGEGSRTFTYDQIVNDMTDYDVRAVSIASALGAGAEMTTAPVFEHIVELNGVKYPFANTYTPDETDAVQYRARASILELNPETGEAWTVDELNAATFGFRTRS